MKMLKFTVAIMVVAMAFGACSPASSGGDDAAAAEDTQVAEETTAPADDAAVPEDDVPAEVAPEEDVQEPEEDLGGEEDVVEDAGEAPEEVTGDKCTPENLRQDALENGTQILDGVAAEASTPISEILADLNGFEGQFVQIEGIVVEICDMAGCYMTLSDPDGNKLNVKVTDWVVDFREVAELGYYVVGEGIQQAGGEHGAQVFIEDHGAMLGTIYCELR